MFQINLIIRGQCFHPQSTKTESSFVESSTTEDCQGFRTGLENRKNPNYRVIRGMNIKTTNRDLRRHKKFGCRAGFVSFRCIKHND